MTPDHARKIEERLTKLEEAVETMKQERAKWIALLVAHSFLSREHDTVEALYFRANIRENINTMMARILQEVEKSEEPPFHGHDLLKEVVEYLEPRYRLY